MEERTAGTFIPQTLITDNQSDGNNVNKDIIKGALKWVAIGVLVLGVIYLLLYVFKR